MSTPVTPPDRIQTSETTEVQISSVNANTNNTSDSPTFPFSSIRINWRENLTSNISNMIQEFRPIFDPSITYLTTNQNESLVLNLENNETEMTSPNYSQDEHIPDTNLRIQTEEDDFNGPTNQNNLSEAFASIPNAVMRYLPYICILIAKSCYDHIDGILDFFALFVTFLHSNKVLRQEITKQDQRSFSPLIRELIFIIIVLGVIGFMLQKKNVPLSLLVALPIDEEFTLKRLLFAAGINDLIIKLLTVAIKIVFTVLPFSLIKLKSRTHIYLVIEAFSQMYRALNPVQGWLLFLLKCYSGTEKIIGVILSGFYIVAKGSDLLNRAKFCKSAVTKFLEKTGLGSKPTKEQINQVSLCTICHDRFVDPILLECNHIFCELCIITWLSRSSICPLCRATVSDNPNYKDGSTSLFLQLY